MTIQELLTEYGVRYLDGGGHHHCRPGWLQMDCPFCSKGAGRYRMGYSLDRGNFCCWVCGPHPAIETLVELTGQSASKCYTLRGGIDFRKLKEVPRPIGKLEVPEGVGPLARQHKAYLRRREFDPEAVERLWKVQGTGISDRLAWRLFIPIHYRGEVVSWTTRSLSDTHSVRYVSARPDQEKLPHRDLLYGEDWCGHAVIVHEGPLDVWATGPGAVCTFGLTYSKTQVLRLSRYPIRVVCFDSEPVAQRRARQLVRDLGPFAGETYCVTLSSKDPAESLRNRASSKELTRLRAFLR